MRRMLDQYAYRALIGTLVAGGLLFSNVTDLRAQEEQEEQEESVAVVVGNFEADEAAETEEETQEPPSLWLGVMLKDVEGDLAKFLGSEEGILVESVFEGSPADEAKLRVGDVLIEANGSKLSQPMDLLTVMKSVEAGDAVKLSVLRKGKRIKVQVKPVERPLVVEGGEVVEAENVVTPNLLLSQEVVGDAELKSLMGKLRLRGGKELELFRVGGGPSYMFRGDGEGKQDLEVTVIKDVDGDKVSVTVVRKDDEPAKITVVEGDEGEAKEYTEEELAELPDEVAEIVKSALAGKKRSRFEIQILPESKMLELNQSEVIAKARALAAERAQMARQQVEQMHAQVQGMGKDAEELKELREMVEKLREELTDLRQQLKEKK